MQCIYHLQEYFDIFIVLIKCEFNKFYICRHMNRWLQHSMLRRNFVSLNSVHKQIVKLVLKFLRLV